MMLSDSLEGRCHMASSVQKKPQNKSLRLCNYKKKKIKDLLISNMHRNIVSHCVKTPLEEKKKTHTVTSYKKKLKRSAVFFKKSRFFPSPSIFIRGRRSPPAWGYTRPTSASRHLSPRSPRTPISQSTCCLVSKTWVRCRSLSLTVTQGQDGGGPFRLMYTSSQKFGLALWI